MPRVLAAFALALGNLANLAGLASALSACGEAVNKPEPPLVAALAASGQATARPVASEAAQIVRPSGMGGASVGALDRPTAMRRFFEGLARLESGLADDDVRIVQLGDSHTAADIQTAVVRRALQARFGDGGRGLVAIGKPWRQYLQEGIRSGMSLEWSPSLGRWDKGKLGGDGMYGLAGIGLAAQRGGRAWVDIAAKTARAEVSYLEQPAGGSFDVLVDGIRVVRVGTRGDRAGSAFRTFGIAEGSAHQLEVRSVGDGDVRVFGVALDRAQHGVVLDALGINGARVTTALSWNEQHWTEQLRHRAPALVVLAYGTNESTDAGLPSAAYERTLVDMLGRVARAEPTAACLLLGPPDRAVSSSGAWTTPGKLLEIIGVQRRVAAAAGCAFYDQLAAMGGAGSVAAWASEDPPRAQRDRVHLTREGYAQLGSSFASDVMRAYAAYRRDAGLPASSARPDAVDVPVSSLPLAPTGDSIAE